MEINPLVAAALGSVFRWALTFGAGWFVSKGIWTQDESTTYVLAASAGAVALLWSVYQKYKTRVQFLNALDSPKGASEAEVKAKGAPNYLKLLVALLALGVAAGSVSACASTPANMDKTATALAIYGKRVSDVLLSAQELAVKSSPSVIPEASLAKAQVQFKNAAGVGKKLGDALELYDALAPSETAKRMAAIGNIHRLMDELRRLTRVVLVLAGDNPAGQELLKLYDNLDTVFAEIEAGINRWQDAALAKK